MDQLKCPNCGTPGIPGEGGSIVCTVCGGRFRFEAGEHRLAGVAEFDRLKQRVDEQAEEIAKLREQLAGKSTTDEADDQADDESDDENEDDDEEF